jgi:hypothetical protein
LNKVFGFLVITPSSIKFFTRVAVNFYNQFCFLYKYNNYSFFLVIQLIKNNFELKQVYQGLTCGHHETQKTHPVPAGLHYDPRLQNINQTYIHYHWETKNKLYLYLQWRCKMNNNHLNLHYKDACHWLESRIVCVLSCITYLIPSRSGTRDTTSDTYNLQPKC